MAIDAIENAGEVSEKSEWDAIAKERETGIPAAEKPQVEVVKPQVVIDPMKDLLEKFEKLEARTRNAEGHIGGLNHNQRQMQETLQAASKAATQKVSEAPSQAQVKTAMKDPDEWAQLKGAYPEWATATEKFFDAKIAQSSGNQLDQAKIDKIVSDRVAGETAAVRKELIDSHLDAIVDGDWMKEVATESFGKWIGGQKPEIQALANSQKMTDAAKMLRLYEQAKINNPTADIIAARKNKLANAATTPKGIRVAPVKAEADMTDAEIWAIESRRRDVARAKRN